MSPRLTSLAAALALGLAGTTLAIEPDERAEAQAGALRTAPVTRALELEAAGFPAGTEGVHVTAARDYVRQISGPQQDKQSISALFGVQAVSRLTLTGPQFVQFSGQGAPNGRTDWGRIYCMTDSSALLAQVQLPAGAQILGVSVYGQDTNPDFNLTLSLRPINYPANYGGAVPPAYGTNLTTMTATSGFSDGYFRLDSPLLDHTVDPGNPYHLRLNLPGCGADGLASGLSFLRADIHFRRQISPAPPTATFGDVPVGGPFHREIEALAASGITLGCGNGNYCPNETVTRGQMAAFLSRALGLHWDSED